MTESMAAGIAGAVGLLAWAVMIVGSRKIPTDGQMGGEE